MTAPKVAIFRQELLPISETFIRDQALALRTFSPHFVGLTRAQRSLPIPGQPTVLTEQTSTFPSMRVRGYRNGLSGTRFFREVQRFSPLLVHAHFAPDGVAAMSLASHLGVPLAVTLHGYDVTIRPELLGSSRVASKLYAWRLRRLWRQADLFICVSEFIRRRALAAGFPAAKLKVHYTGIDCEAFPARTSARESGLVVFVGRLVEKKGCRQMLEALRRTMQRVPGAHAVVIGEGPLRAELESFARDASLPVQFLGGQSSEQVRSWLSEAQVFCVPSTTASNGDSEGFGMVFTEAQAVGTPVVSYRHGGIPEAVADGETGLLVNEGDIDALSDAIEVLLKDAQRWARFSEAGTAWVAARFDLRVQTAKLETIYRELMGEHGSLHLERTA